MNKRVRPFGRLLLVSCCLALVGDAGCHREPAAEVLFPPSNDAAGWFRSSDIRTFEAAELWKYIDGEAERYWKAGVRRVCTADYKYHNQVDAVVDIYAMNNAQGPKQILDSEPAGDAKSVPLGDGARLYGQCLVFRKGPYLVRIVAYQQSEETPHELWELGQVIEQRMRR